MWFLKILEALKEAGKVRSGYPQIGQAVIGVMALLCTAAVETSESYHWHGADVPGMDKYIHTGLEE